MNQRAIAEFEATSPSVDSMIEMQVSLAEQVPSLILSPAAAAQVLDEQGKPLQQLAAAASYPIRANGNAIQLGSWEFPSSVWINLPLDGLFSLGDRTYRGQLLLVAEAGHLWAVNHVNMRHYLYSVVGSEVPPTWDMEALKAQAVAARSYALVHYFRPASPVFHLGSTQAYQVYSGIEREADTIRQAVDTTAGEFVGQNGGIVESMYAASDEIVASAFEGRGMSQLGALDLAQQGYSYEQILSNYYPGTAITRIELEH
jgi:peptidoglycan hydrolase-like amidase